MRVWRTGVGIDRRGNVIYAAANYQTVTTLAGILQRAGAVRAMELDINAEWPTLITYRHRDGLLPPRSSPTASSRPPATSSPTTATSLPSTDAYQAGSPSRSNSRLRRWARRLALGLLAFIVAVTLAAFVFDLATNGSARPASSLYPGPFVRVDGTLLAYRSWGHTGSPLVLLGGAAEPSWVWHDVGPLLARRGHRVYAVDLPPFGYSQRRGPYTMAHWLQLLQGFERRLHIDRPVLVGHSLGAGVAAAAALAHPHDVAGVALLDGDALAFGGNHGWLANLLIYPYYTAVYRIVTGSDWLIGRVYRNAWGQSPPHPDHATLAQFERPFRVQGTETALKQLFAGGIPGLTLPSSHTYTSRGQ